MYGENSQIPTKMASNETSFEEGSATERVVPEETDKNSVSDVPISMIKILMRIEKVNGDPLPESLMNPQQLNVFCVQYAGEQPYHIELLSSYEACVSYKEGVVIAVVAGRLMNATAWNEIPLVVSCTLVPKEKMSAIVQARERVRGAWNENERKEDELSEGENLSEHSSSQLKHRVEQIATHEKEMSKKMEKCMEQQQKLAHLVEGLGEQLSQLQLNSAPTIAGKDFPTPRVSQVQGLSPMPNHQFRIQTDLDLGKFSGTDPVPTNELTFEQWLSDIRAYQRQFPEFVLLPAVRKSIQGRAKSVLRNLGPDYTIDQAIDVLTREYEGVANSDVVFKEFYQLKQEKNEKVQIFSVRLREALNKLTLRFPDRVPAGDEDRILCDRFFYGMKAELKTSVRHLFDSPDVSFSTLLTAARRNELEEVEQKPVRIQNKSAKAVVEEETSPQTESIKGLREQIQELATVMKSGNTSYRPNPPAVNGNAAKKPKRANVRRNGAADSGVDARKELTGPEANASGPFPPGQRPLQCHKCKGWGHVKRVCPSRLNYSRGGRAKGRTSPPPNQESAETQTSTPEGTQ